MRGVSARGLRGCRRPRPRAGNDIPDARVGTPARSGSRPRAPCGSSVLSSQSGHLPSRAGTQRSMRALGHRVVGAAGVRDGERVAEHHVEVLGSPLAIPRAEGLRDGELGVGRRPRVDRRERVDESTAQRGDRRVGELAEQSARRCLVAGAADAGRPGGVGAVGGRLQHVGPAGELLVGGRAAPWWCRSCPAGAAGRRARRSARPGSLAWPVARGRRPPRPGRRHVRATARRRLRGAPPPRRSSSVSSASSARVGARRVAASAAARARFGSTAADGVGSRVVTASATSRTARRHRDRRHRRHRHRRHRVSARARARGRGRVDGVGAARGRTPSTWRRARRRAGSGSTSRPLAARRRARRRAGASSTGALGAGPDGDDDGAGSSAMSRVACISARSTTWYVSTSRPRPARSSAI